MENTQIIMEKIERLDNKVNGLVNQLDLDRRDIDNLRIDQSQIKEGQTAILNQMTDFKKEIRQIIEDTIAVELPKVVKREIRLLSVKNPRKKVAGKIGLLERIKLLFNR